MLGDATSSQGNPFESLIYHEARSYRSAWPSGRIGAPFDGGSFCADVSNETLAVLAKDAAVIADGKKMFVSTCAPCHGIQGQGIVGPNLTDGFWLHGSKPIDIFTSVTNGYPEKGMRPWGPVLGTARIRAVTAFVVSIKGTNVAGRPPQGVASE